MGTQTAPAMLLEQGVGETTNRTFGYIEPLYSTMLNFSWDMFDGFSRRNSVREAEARRGEAAADLSSLQPRTLREVWKTYADVKAVLLQHEYAEALLTASQDAYNAVFTGYQTGSVPSLSCSLPSATSPAPG